MIQSTFAISEEKRKAGILPLSAAEQKIDIIVRRADHGQDSFRIILAADSFHCKPGLSQQLIRLHSEDPLMINLTEARDAFPVRPASFPAHRQATLSPSGHLHDGHPGCVIDRIQQFQQPWTGTDHPVSCFRPEP